MAGTSPIKTSIDDLVHDASVALTDGNEADVERLIAKQIRITPDNVRLLHHNALLLRALDRRSEAIDLLDRALRLSPNDASVSHALAQATLEAGRPASHLFEEAVRLEPGSTDLRLGLASARLAENNNDLAISELQTLLSANPGWYAGHRQFAQLSSMCNRPSRAFVTLDQALERFPLSIDLHETKIDLLTEAGRFDDALAAAQQASAVLEGWFGLSFRRAIAHDELFELTASSAFFERLGQPKTMSHAVRKVRHLIRTGRIDDAAAEAEPWLTANDGEMWPYAAVIWRINCDPRADWLERQQGQVKTLDLKLDEAQQGSIANELDALHAQSGRFLDQSVRGGTQTNGPLLARETPNIARLRERLRQEVSSYIQALPSTVENHPQLGVRRDGDVRFAGSWSVSLTDAGYHEPHHHPAGWISGVCYVATPTSASADEGNLEISCAPVGLGIDAPSLTTIRPQPGRLVLFPSFMWHRTTPFDQGRRVTVAFDIARVPGRA